MEEERRRQEARGMRLLSARATGHAERFLAAKVVLSLIEQEDEALERARAEKEAKSYAPLATAKRDSVAV